ncbi:hypothetical protein N9J12_08585 [Alphaproteobacteria bacterium]|nr:hypothetical protein [Alphaproteobacteria bacterium]
MTRKLTLFAVCAFEVALILFVAAWTALADVLPDVSPEEQYRFSLGKALANDLVTAEAAFDEFREVNKGHERFADATFWLGRVQFVQGKYEQAAMTFSEFNTNFPTDNRLVKTTMWIAESVSRFAPREQACKIYYSLPKLLGKPPESFLTQLGALASAAKCGETVIASLKGSKAGESEVSGKVQAKEVSLGVWFPTDKPNCQVWNPTLKTDETALWSGECRNGKAHGEGVTTWKWREDGEFVTRLVEGERKDGRQVGKVKIKFENGHTYFGSLNANGLQHDGQGNLTYANGGKYVGEFSNGVKHGQGNLTYANGEKYVGEWKDNKRDGEGALTLASGTKYVGEWKNGKQDGKGTLTGADGYKYAGDWKDGKKDGEGTLTWANGYKYVGEWKDGKKNGRGTETIADGLKFEGEWRDGKKNGQGTQTFANGDKAEGEWKDGLYPGLIKMTSSEGQQIIGEYVDGKFHGPVYTEFDGKYGIVFLDHGEVKPYKDIKISSFNNHKKLTADELKSTKNDGVVRHPFDHAFSYRCEQTSNTAPEVIETSLITKNPKYTITASNGVVVKSPNSGGLSEFVLARGIDEKIAKSFSLKTQGDKLGIVGKKITLGQGFETQQTIDLADLSNFSPVISGGKVTDLRQSKLIPVKYTKYRNMVSLQTIQTSGKEVVIKIMDREGSFTMEESSTETIHLESGVVVESTGVGSIVSYKIDGKDQPFPSNLKNIKVVKRCVLVNKVPVK